MESQVRAQKALLGAYLFITEVKTMADKQYKLSKAAEIIDKIINGAVAFSFAQNLSEKEKAQARENIGAGSSDSGMTILGYFDTYDELVATITNPASGHAYGVGTAYPYDIYIWDGLHSAWVNNGNIRGADGKDGADAEITPEQVESGLGYNPGMVNPNLLDNWYFANPVNQRGSTAYSSAGLTIDRWKLTAAGRFGVSTNIAWRIGSSAAGTTLKQILETNISDVATLSVFVPWISGTLKLRAQTSTGTYIGIDITSPGVYAYKVPAGYSISAFTLIADAGNFADVLAVKLELGLVQTLARQVAGVWTLNELPDYGEQLARCQRFFARFPLINTGRYGLGMAHSASQIVVNMPLSTAMRVLPTVSCSDISLLKLFSATAELVPSAISVYTKSNNFVAVRFIVTGATIGEVYQLVATGDVNINISADL